MNVGGGNHFAVYILRRHVVGFVSRLGLVSVTPISGYIYIYMLFVSSSMYWCGVTSGMSMMLRYLFTLNRSRDMDIESKFVTFTIETNLGWRRWRQEFLSNTSIHVAELEEGPRNRCILTSLINVMLLVPQGN